MKSESIKNQLIHGPLAHLVERIHGMDEATGSNPVWSTLVFQLFFVKI